MRSGTGVFVAGVVVALSAMAPADAAGPEPTSTNPIAVLGGVVAIPLKTPAEGTGFPAEMSIIVKDGAASSRVTGRVVWLVDPGSSRGANLERHWTASANPLVVRQLPDGGDPRSLIGEEAISVAGALVLAQLPLTSTKATLRLGETELSPQWIEPGPPPAIDPELGASWRDDRPDPISPFDWFRWTLFAEARNELAPAPPGDAATQLMARHVADLWRAGLARVARQSRGVSLTLRAWLTATCRVEDMSGARKLLGESGREIAAWIADSADMSSLLSLLLDQTRDDDATMRAALAWSDARTPLTMWIDSDVAGVLTFAVANPLESEIVVRVQWLGEQLPPLATLVPPRTIGHMRVERPVRPTKLGSLGGDAPEALVLSLAAENFRKRIAVAPAAVAARPPAISFGEFVARVNLWEAQSGRSTPVAPEWATTASLRRRGERWELFAECRAPRSTDDDGVRIVLGGKELKVRRDGTVSGDTELGFDLGVRTFDGLWRFRLALPNAWVPKPVDGSAIVRMSLRREVGPLRTTAVLAVPAHADRDGTVPSVEVDLGAWSASERSER